MCLSTICVTACGKTTYNPPPNVTLPTVPLMGPKVEAELWPRCFPTLEDGTQLNLCPHWERWLNRQNRFIPAYLRAGGTAK